MGQDESFDVMADLCIMAGQAVMTVGSDELRAAMRIVLGILGQEVAARGRDEKPAKAKGGRSIKPVDAGALKPSRRGSLAPCA